MTTTTQINYLGTTAPDGSAHGGWQDRRPSTPVASTVVQLPEPLPVEGLRVGWGDRERSAAELPIWTTPDADGIELSSGRDGVRAYRRVNAHDRYQVERMPAWAPAFLAACEAVRAAAQQAEETRQEVATVCADYRRTLRQIDEQTARHYARWEQDVAAIARRFRRATVVVGEQTVPGKCIVRSTRGRTLGYAHVWDGRWTGRVERV